jgi:hypothetical protein
MSETPAGGCARRIHVVLKFGEKVFYFQRAGQAVRGGFGIQPLSSPFMPTWQNAVSYSVSAVASATNNLLGKYNRHTCNQTAMRMTQSPRARTVAPISPSDMITLDFASTGRLSPPYACGVGCWVLSQVRGRDFPRHAKDDSGPKTSRARWV